MKDNKEEKAESHHLSECDFGDWELLTTISIGGDDYRP